MPAPAVIGARFMLRRALGSLSFTEAGLKLSGGEYRMSGTQKLGLGLFYAAMAGLGAAYAIFENHQANQLVHFVNELVPSFLILILVVLVYGLFRRAVSVLKQLNGVSGAAHATLYEDYGIQRKKRA